MRPKTYMSRVLLISMLALAALPATLLAFWWASDLEGHIDRQTSIWAEQLLERRRSLLRDEADAALDFIGYKRSTVQRLLREQIRSRTLEGWSVVDAIYQRYRQVEAREQILQRIADQLGAERFNGGRGYYFINDLDGRTVVHGLRADYQAQLQAERRDSDGFAFINAFRDVAITRGEGFVEYRMQHPTRSSEVEYRKLAFIKYYPPLGIYIGTGDYEIDIEEKIRQEILERLTIMPYDPSRAVVFLLQESGLNLVNGVSPGVIISDLSGQPDADDLLERVQQQARQPEGGFVEMNWVEGDDERPVLLYVRQVPDWDWIIGAGSYLDPLQQTLQAEVRDLRDWVRQYVGKIVLVLALLVLLAAVISLRISRFTRDGFGQFIRFFQEASTEQHRIDRDHLPFVEFQQLADAANRMLAERCRFEAALLDKEQRLQSALNVSFNVLWELNMQTNVLSFGEESSSADFGALQQVGKLADLLALVHPADRAEVAHALSRLEQGDTTGSLEFRLYLQPGQETSLRWLYCRGAVVAFDQEQRPLRSLGTVVDITDRKRMERELDDARIRAEESSFAKSQFLANMSHELRTPLNGILGYAQLLLRSGGLTAEQRERLQALEGSGNHLLNLISDTLELARVESGGITLKPQVCNLLQLAQRVAELVRPRAWDKGLEFELQLPSQPLPLQWLDEHRLQQVLVQLLGQALKRTQQGRVALVLQLTTQTVQLDIIDSGEAIPPARLSNLFQPFSLLGDDKDAGLSLAISQRLILSMGGVLHVTSDAGQGSCFSIILPVNAPPADVLPELRLRQRLCSERQLQAIVADDNPVNREVLSSMLRHTGIQTRTVEDGQALLQALQEQPADLVLLDVHMPRVDGFAAAAAIRANPDWQALTLIAVSATLSPGEVERMRQAGCDDFLGKPVRINELIGMIACHLQLPLQATVDALPCGGSSNPCLPELPAALRQTLSEALDQGDLNALRGIVEALPHEGEITHNLQQMLATFDLPAIRRWVQREYLQESG